MAPWIANLSAAELLLILSLIGLLVGGAKLPELARGAGRALRSLKRSRPGEIERSTSVD